MTLDYSIMKISLNKNISMVVRKTMLKASRMREESLDSE